jgi:Heterokaryon incompatibility protein (HET)
MHLLKIDSDGTLSLTKFIGDKIPRYAVLSHTWEAENQEVTFKDITDGSVSSKAGYRKIHFCGEQANRDGLQYFWVDSCCIDKSSSADLAEAINSMFRWYENAAQCYVYLSDVSTSDIDQYAQSSQLPYESAFRQSRWFTRGWTLQELLAPSLVEFFSHDGKRLGDKKLLEVQIHEITGIAVQALRGSPLSQFSVAERMSWAAKRKTTIAEDKAYCLLGIFDIYLPLIYGEGMKNAFIRLQDEIDRRSSVNSGGALTSKLPAYGRSTPAKSQGWEC